MLRSFLARAHAWLNPSHRDLIAENRALYRRLDEAIAHQATPNSPRARYLERAAELAEARAMAGAGPWVVGPDAREQTDKILKEAFREVSMREADGALPGGYGGNLELMLDASGWRREVSSTALEFSRWGVQQIILITRLKYIKDPIIRRLVNVCAAYVFARGVSVTSSDETANEVIRDFFEINKQTLGQNALCDLERRKDYDGNIFFCLFTDTQNRGMVRVRTIDATEISEIITDPEDTDSPRYYKRSWTQSVFDEAKGTAQTQNREAWYPAISYNPDVKPATIGGKPVLWDSPVLHRKAGAIGKWQFGCPRIYPAVEWARESARYLSSCANVAQALSEVALVFTTKGGQAAIAGAKEQLGSTVDAMGGLWDTNPPGSSGGTVAYGPGSKLEAFKTSGAGLDPEKVRQYKLMCCMVADVPETFLGDVQTGNLATASSLDRPTETAFLEKQEAWREDLVTLSQYAIRASMVAPGGRIREALQKRDGKPSTVEIREAATTITKKGRRVYSEARDYRPADGAIEIRAEFPAIREGDVPGLITAVTNAMTLGSPSGGVTGIDKKEGIRALYDLLGIENGDEIVELQYPSESYDPERVDDVEEEPAASVPLAQQPSLPGARKVPARQSEADRMEAGFRNLGRAMKAYEEETLRQASLMEAANGASHTR